jgi:hypothetical protein
MRCADAIQSREFMANSPNAEAGSLLLPQPSGRAINDGASFCDGSTTLKGYVTFYARPVKFEVAFRDATAPTRIVPGRFILLTFSGLARFLRLRLVGLPSRPPTCAVKVNCWGQYGR